MSHFSPSRRLPTFPCSSSSFLRLSNVVISFAMCALATSKIQYLPPRSITKCSSKYHIISHPLGTSFQKHMRAYSSLADLSLSLSLSVCVCLCSLASQLAFKGAFEDVFAFCEVWYCFFDGLTLKNFSTCLSSSVVYLAISTPTRGGFFRPPRFSPVYRNQGAGLGKFTAYLPDFGQVFLVSRFPYPGVLQRFSTRNCTRLYYYLFLTNVWFGPRRAMQTVKPTRLFFALTDRIRYRASNCHFLLCRRSGSALGIL